MKKIILSIICLVFISSCGEEKRSTKTPAMEKQARETILAYLAKKQLPADGLNEFISSVKPAPDYSYLYTGAGRCIEFIVYCYGDDCTEWHKYPYDEHGDQCP